MSTGKVYGNCSYIWILSYVILFYLIWILSCIWILFCAIRL